MSEAVNYPRLRLRVDPANPNHHLWNNNGTWYLHYTLQTSPLTVERVRRSLRTGDLETARHQRDAFLRVADPTRAT